MTKPRRYNNDEGSITRIEEVQEGLGVITKLRRYNND
jgi:hypothetical protein